MQAAHKVKMILFLKPHQKGKEYAKEIFTAQPT